jgi:hypothetical protein
MQTKQLDEIFPLATAPKSAKVNKGAKALKELYECGTLTESDVDFIIAATDPFHDKDLPHLMGLPSGQRAKSIVHDITQTVNIVRPPGFGQPSWNFMISTQPILTRTVLGRRKAFGTDLVPVDTGPHVIGAVNFSFADGNVDFDDTYFSPPVDPLNPPLNFLEGPCQVIGMAIEVVNTTAVIARQGACYSAVQNQNPFRLTTMKLCHTTSGAAGNSPTASYYECRKPPKNLPELSLLPPVTQRLAEEGAFAVCRMNYDQFSYTNTLPTMPMLTDQDFVPGTIANDTAHEIDVFTPNTVVHTWVHPEPDITTTSFADNPVANPSQMTIIMFTGLSTETSLDVKVRWLLQRFPSEQNPTVINLAKTSPPRNDYAFEIVDHILSQLPPSVPVDWNEDGGWWSTVLEALSDLAPLVGLIPHPIAQGISTGMAMVGKKKANNQKDEEIRKLRELLEQFMRQGKGNQALVVRPVVKQQNPASVKKTEMKTPPKTVKMITPSPKPKIDKKVAQKKT